MKWNKTGEMRRFLFGRVLRDHGKWSTWNDKQKPPGLSVKEWKGYSRKLAEEMNEKFETDIKPNGPLMQVAFATSWAKGQPNLVGGHVKNFILCMTAAFEAGFLAPGEYPKHMKIVKDEF